MIERPLGPNRRRSPWTEKTNRAGDQLIGGGIELPLADKTLRGPVVGVDTGILQAKSVA
jgi:hypothetical protein